MNRLNHLPTLRINTSEKLSLTYQGKSYLGVAGDTVATALFANGVRIFGRSLKYHRPRGLYSLDGECSNTCMEVEGIPNVRSENTLLKDGMKVCVQEAPTRFGKVSYTITSSVASGQIEAVIQSPDRAPPRRIVLRIRHPEGKRMRTVTVGGQPHSEFDPAQDTISIAPAVEPIRVRVEY